jgi:hypothetical protein
MSISLNQVNELQKVDPVAQKIKLGEAVYGAPIVIKKAITADATGEVSVTIPYAMEVVDVIVQCTAANGSGSLTLKKGSTAVTDAIACVTDKVIVRAGTIDDSVSTFAAGDAVSIDANGAGDRGIMWIMGYRL